MTAIRTPEAIALLLNGVVARLSLRRGAYLRPDVTDCSEVNPVKLATSVLQNGERGLTGRSE